MANWAVVIGIDSTGRTARTSAARSATRSPCANGWSTRPAADVPPGNMALVLEPGPNEPAGRPGAERARRDEGEHHRRDQQPDRHERRAGRPPLLLLRRPRADGPRRQPRRERAARDRLQRRQHRPLDRAALALGVLRDDAVQRPVLLRRRLPRRPGVAREEFEIGRWTLPRTRDPGPPPVQQFILYATSPG